MHSKQTKNIFFKMYNENLASHYYTKKYKVYETQMEARSTQTKKVLSTFPKRSTLGQTPALKEMLPRTFRYRSLS